MRRRRRSNPRRSRRSFAWGPTPRHWSAATGHLEAVKLLLAHGANTKLKNDMGRTPKDDAKKYKFEECVKAFK